MARRVWIGLRHDECDVGNARGGREPFLAVQDIGVVALLLRARLHAGGVGARGFLRHRIADALLAVQERLEEFLFLEVRTVLKQGEHGRVVRTLRVHRQRAEIAFAKLHLHQRVGERAKPHAAIFLRDERAPQPLRACFLAQFRQRGLVVRAVEQLFLGGAALVFHPLAHLRANGLGFRRNFKVDRHLVVSSISDFRFRD